MTLTGVAFVMLMGANCAPARQPDYLDKTKDQPSAVSMDMDSADDYGAYGRDPCQVRVFPNEAAVREYFLHWKMADTYHIYEVGKGCNGGLSLKPVVVDQVDLPSYSVEIRR